MGISESFFSSTLHTPDLIHKALKTCNIKNPSRTEIHMMNLPTYTLLSNLGIKVRQSSKKSNCYAKIFRHTKFEIPCKEV